MHTTFIFAPSRAFIIIVTLLLLSGCATRHTDVSQSSHIANNIAEQDLSTLTQFTLRGKLAIITPSERKSAYLSWQQQRSEFLMNLNTVVGTNIATMRFDGVMASMQSDNNEWQAPSPSELIHRVTGWQVPLDNLEEWMKGQVETSLVDEYYENGLVKQFTSQCKGCLRWKITYNSYASFELDGQRYTLPSALRLEQADTNTRLILRIDRWLPADA